MIKRVFIITLLLLAGLAHAEPFTPTHLDPTKVLYRCATCHSPHARQGSGLLREPVPELCFQCHGPRQVFPAMSTYIYDEFQKKYHHPVSETASLHRLNEDYPERDASKPRHVSCLDCHNVHTSTPDEPFRSVPGYSIYGRKVRAKKDSELCYKCHGESENRPPESENMRDLFDPMNPSFHPVEDIARNLSPSLYPDLTGKTISCTDCHNPHGSDYKGMLKKRYSLEDAPETSDTYALCYSCHRRTEVLSDRTFPWHRLHVVYQSISCNACHDPHGSPFYPGLVRFRTDVGPDAHGRLVYIKEKNSMNCYLNCHGVEHNGQSVKRQ